MSQSDYIKHKRVATELEINKNPPVFNSGVYTSFLAYNLESTIINTKPDLSQLIPSTSQIIFNMKLQVKSCPAFIACNNTNIRPNRVNSAYVPSGTFPYVSPSRPITEKQLSKYIDLSIHKSNLCNCVSQTENDDAISVLSIE